MFLISTPYMNESFSRAISEGSHSIHCNSHADVIDYLVDTYGMSPESSHVITNSGQVFEVKRHGVTQQGTTYVSLTAM